MAPSKGAVLGFTSVSAVVASDLDKVLRTCGECGATAAVHSLRFGDTPVGCRLLPRAVALGCELGWREADSCSDIHSG